MLGESETKAGSVEFGQAGAGIGESDAFAREARGWQAGSPSARGP